MTRAIRKKILIAGGAGFLGINLCKSLLGDGHEVFIFDSFPAGSRNKIDYQFEAEKSSKGVLQILEQNVTHHMDLIHLEMHEIYNMMADTPSRRYQKDPLQTLRTNTEGISNLLKLAMKHRIKILQSSDSESYGEPELQQQTSFDEGQRCAESLCMDFHRMYGLEVKIARIFNTYGPFMQPNDEQIIANFIVQALRNQPITIYGDGEQTQSLCYVDDLIAGLRALMDSPQPIVRPVNLGNPSEFTVLEIAEKIIALTGSSSPLIFEPHLEDDTKPAPDISRAKQLLNWEPQTPLETGLARTIDYFERLLQNNASFAALQNSRPHYQGEIVL